MRIIIFGQLGAFSHGLMEYTSSFQITATLWKHAVQTEYNLCLGGTIRHQWIKREAMTTNILM